MSDLRVKPEHGGCLTAWLVVSALLSIVAVVALLGVADIANQIGRGWIVYLFLGLVVVQVISIVGVFSWRKWGVYGLIITIIASSVVQIIGGIATTRDYVAPFIQLALLYYLVNKKWEYFD